MYMYIYTYIYIYIHIYIYIINIQNVQQNIYLSLKKYFLISYIYLHIAVSFCSISVIAQIGIGTISIISIVTQISRPTFLRQGF